MFQQPIIELEQEEELTLDQKLKKYKDMRIEDELNKALKRTGADKDTNLFSKLKSSLNKQGVKYGS